MANRIRRCENRHEMEKLIDDYTMAGYKVERVGDFSTLVVKKKKSSCLVHALLFCILPIIGNIIYTICSSGNEDEVLIKIEPND